MFFVFCILAFEFFKFNFGKDLVDIFSDLPDPRLNGHECGLPFQTTEFFLCDPDSILATEDQAKLITVLNTVYATRTHTCDDGVSEPLLMTIFLLSGNVSAKNDDPDVSYTDLLLERILGKTKILPSVPESNALNTNPSLPLCGQHVALLVNPNADRPILSLRCEDALEPLFTEMNYPSLLEDLVNLYTSFTPEEGKIASMNPDSSLSHFVTLRLVHVIEEISKNFPLTGKKKVESEQMTPIRIAPEKESLTSVIEGIKVEYDHSIQELEVEAEEQIEKIVRGNFNPKENLTRVFTSHLKDLLIIGTVFAAWSLFLEVLHQILIRRFKREDEPHFLRDQTTAYLEKTEKEPSISQKNCRTF